MKFKTFFLRSTCTLARLLTYAGITLYALFVFGSAAFFLLLVTLITLTSARGLVL